VSIILNSRQIGIWTPSQYDTAVTSCDSTRRTCHTALSRCSALRLPTSLSITMLDMSTFVQVVSNYTDTIEAIPLRLIYALTLLSPHSYTKEDIDIGILMGGQAAPRFTLLILLSLHLPSNQSYIGSCFSATVSLPLQLSQLITANPSPRLACRLFPPDSRSDFTPHFIS
jgi:hypothetical protein